MRRLPWTLMLVGQALLLIALPAGAQSRSPKVFARCNKPLRSMDMDLATGTIRARPRVQDRSTTTVVDFDNNDLSGFVGVDTGNGFCEWFDAGVKGTGGGSSDLMSSVTFAYCSARLDPRSGGPGGSVRLAFYEGYAVGGGAPTTGVAAFTLTGLPAHSASSSFSARGFSCYLVRVTFDSLVAFADGPIGYSWRFLDVGSTGPASGTWPFLSCVGSCSATAQQIDGQGMVDRIDRYCPPGVLRSSFTFGTTSGSFTSMSMAIEEKKPEPTTGFERLPENTHNAVRCVDGGSGDTLLSDEEVAKALFEALKGNKFHSLVVVFASCHSGGFVQQIYDVFGDKITRPVFVMSAARWDKASKADIEIKNFDGITAAQNLWSREYWNDVNWRHNPLSYNKDTNQLLNLNEGEKAIFDKVAKRVDDGIPQWAALNDGGKIRIGGGEDPAATNRYSFAKNFKALVVGNAKREPPPGIAGIDAEWNTMGGQLRGLKYSWAEAFVKRGDNGGKTREAKTPPKQQSDAFPHNNVSFIFEEGRAPNPNNTVTTGDKAPKRVDGQATKNQILASLKGLNPNDLDVQVYVFIGMHGCAMKDGKMIVFPAAAPPPESALLSPQNTLVLPALEGFQLAELDSVANMTGPLLELQVSALGGNVIPPGYAIYFNGVPVYPDGSMVNAIPDGSPEVQLTLSVPANLVTASGNTVWLPNPSPSAAPIWVHASFTTGAIAERHERPQPIH